MTGNEVFVGELWQTSHTKKKHTCPVHDEHAGLSMDAEDSMDTDSEESVQHLGIKPYQYEFYLSGAGAGENGGSEDDGTGSDEDD